MLQYIINVLLGLDFMVNAILGGHPRETMSSRAYRMAQKKQHVWGWTASFINALFFNKNHCKIAYDLDRNTPLED